MVQQKPMFQIVKKSNMATVLMIINNNLELITEKYARVGMYGADLFHFLHVTYL